MLKFSFDEIKDDKITGKVSWRTGTSGEFNGYWCTNDKADGVFWVTPNSRHQHEGTCSFSVYGLKPASARAKIRKWMDTDEEHH